MILTARVGENAELFADILKLYCPPPARVCDLTYGKGNFWKKTKVGDGYDLARNDRYPQEGVEVDTSFDLRTTGYEGESFSLVVFDPPYAAHGTPMKASIDGCYQGSKLDGPLSSAGVMELYRSGVAEARRILRPPFLEGHGKATGLPVAPR